MTKSITFDDEAVEELESAAQWYEARRQDLGIDFVRDVREALLRIASRPDTWPLAPNVPEHLNAHRFVLRRFPTQSCLPSMLARFACSRSRTRVANQASGATDSEQQPRPRAQQLLR